MSGQASSSPALSGFTLPPYWTTTRAAVASPNVSASQPPDECVDLLGLLGRGDQAGADRPDRLVGEHRRRPSARASSPASEPSNWPSTTRLGLLRLALCSGLADADDRDQPGGQGGVDLLVDLGVGLAQDVPPLAVAEDDVGAADVAGASPRRSRR